MAADDKPVSPGGVRLKGFDKVRPPDPPSTPITPTPEPTAPRLKGFGPRPAAVPAPDEPADAKHEAEESHVQAPSPKQEVQSGVRVNFPISGPPNDEAQASGLRVNWPAAPTPSSAPSSAPRPYKPDTDPLRISRRQLWKDQLYTKSGRRKADEILYGTPPQEQAPQ